MARTERKAVKLWTWRRMLRDHGPEHPGVLLTCYTIGTFMDDDGFGFPGQQKIALGARVSARTVRRHIEQAEVLGWLHVEVQHFGGKGWRRNVYRAAVPAHIELSEVDEDLRDAVLASFGDVDDSASQSERADTIVSSPNEGDNRHAPVTCGHPAHEGEDIPRQGEDIRRQGEDIAMSGEVFSLKSSVRSSQEEEGALGAPRAPDELLKTAFKGTKKRTAKPHPSKAEQLAALEAKKRASKG